MLQLANYTWLLIWVTPADRVKTTLQSTKCAYWLTDFVRLLFIDIYDTKAFSLLLQCPFSLKVICSLFHCISLSLPSSQVICGWGCKALLSGDLEGGHTDQGSAAGWAVHPQSGEWVMGFLHAGKSLWPLKCIFWLGVRLLWVPHGRCA